MRTLEITTKIGCKNRCVYCPQDKLLSSYSGDTYMGFQDFIRILDNVPKDVRIDFSGFCEPFLNVKSPHMMEYALKNGYHLVLYTTLVGFQPEYIRLLKDCIFDEIVFHHFEGVEFDEKQFNTYSELIRTTIQSRGFRTVILEPQWRWSRAGNVWDMKEKKGKFQCLYAGKDFDHNGVLPNGDVYICCQDYGLEHKIGNLFETKYDDLNRKVLRDLSDQEDSKIICRKCELIKLNE